MRPFALALALLVAIAPLGMASASDDSFDPLAAPVSELVSRSQLTPLTPARPAPRSNELRQATRKGVVERLARRRELAGGKRQAAPSSSPTGCISDSTAAAGTPQYAVFHTVTVVGSAVSL